MNKFVEPEKITIVSGPAPFFRFENNSVFYSIFDTPTDFYMQQCTLRTMDGNSLVSRCRNAWGDGKEIYLEYSDIFGMVTHELIVAAKTTGQKGEELLILWLRVGGKTVYDV